MTNRWRRFVWLSIGIDYQYQSIDTFKLLLIGIDKKLSKKFTNREYLHVVAKEDIQAGTVGGRVVHDGIQL